MNRSLAVKDCKGERSIQKSNVKLMNDEHLNRKSGDEKGEKGINLGKYLKYNLGLGLRKGKGNQ